MKLTISIADRFNLDCHYTVGRSIETRSLAQKLAIISHVRSPVLITDERTKSSFTNPP
ncbi:hypothetical protein [Chamaesiphon sp. VAR_69_metabat_338]|uniref:hypothetical protein n=1 Tax=Chamaesiphon sp. VAR_69_metabat_338 TaxID=2964704 RepID=UPI00286DFDBE|nr:hypothetical protein [Chamaesiphon sp. VAR_69_metabat_338]